MTTPLGGWVRTWKASGAILDPEIDIEMPAIAYVGDPPHDSPIVAEETRLDLFGGAVVLLFSRSKYIPLVIPEPQDRFPWDPLLYFITYRSRVNYNIFGPEHLALNPCHLTPRDRVTFSVQKVTSDFTTVRHEIEITKGEIEDLLRLCTEQLYLALAYYLIGCENRRYFLIEFYKAIEVIENVFGGEEAAIERLKEHGVRAADFKGLKRRANDQHRPLDIGRHAPRGRPLTVIDLRRLLTDPLSRDVFAESVVATRQAIDAYFSYIRATAARCGNSLATPRQ